MTTGARGTWSATLPRGPSRIVEAVYGGDATTEGASSGQVRVIVPAKVSCSASRDASRGAEPFGSPVSCSVGICRPKERSCGCGSGREQLQTYGVQEHVTGRGRFTTTYTFGAGYAGILKSYWFQIATLPMGDYPYAPAASGRRSVLVGGHPRSPATRRRRPKHTRGRKHKGHRAKHGKR